MTLLSRKDGASVSDFRAYWASCHAQLALCMNGISNYTQNRVDKTLWQSSDGAGSFEIDGVVELCFESDEAMSVAQQSAVGSKYLPDDELKFLRGWTLCVVEHEDELIEQAGVKVIVAAVMKDDVSRTAFRNAIVEANNSQATPATISFNWTISSAKRERLWAEPVAPTVLVALGFKNTAQAHEAFEADNSFAQKLGGLSSRAAAYLISPLVVK